MEIFSEQLWHLPVFRDHIEGEYQHLIFDNIEEDAPVIHDLVLDWIPSFDSALFIYDSEGGYRSFRGADPISAMRLKSACDEVPLERTEKAWCIIATSLMIPSIEGSTHD